MDDAVKRWAQARMAPSTWSQLVRAGARLSAAGATARRTGATLGDRMTWIATERFEPWRLGFAAVSVVLPAVILAFLPEELHVGVPALLLFSLIISTYVADLIGGVVALLVGMVCLDLLFKESAFEFSPPDSAPSLILLATYLFVGVALIGMVERLKRDRANARLEAAAMRAGNAALNAVELAAASRPAGDVDAYMRVLDSLVTAMARVNRASVGALYLVDDSGQRLTRVAVYGETADAYPIDVDNLTVESGFAGRLARERRPVMLHQFSDESDVDDVLATNRHVKSVAGVPLIGPSDRVVGVAWIGLHVRHHFSQITIARLEALAHRTVAFLEAAKLADAQEELLDRVQHHHRRLQSVVQAIPEAVMVVRPPHGSIVTSNAAAQRMFGIGPSAHPFMLRVTQLKVRTPDGAEADEQPIIRALAQNEIVTGAELLVTQRDGSELPVVASAAPLLAEDGTIDAVVGIFQDVRPLKDAQRLRDEFISVVSHELRSPLTPIRGFTQLVARHLEVSGGHEQQLDWLRITQRHVDRMIRLIDDLLDVSRLRAGRLETKTEQIDVVEICRGVVASRQATTEHHTIKLVTEREHLDAILDGDRIHQVVDNLVGNAIKYTAGGTIQVGVDQPADQPGFLSITVSDQGPGIARSERDSLFTPFYRSPDASASALPGLGLGLFICHELIAAHGGRVEVDDAVGGGARFTVWLPIGDVQAHRLSA